ncbi:MAG TPA: hypothetical protein VG937_30230 [Polyangiaceae bacterium]|nr:hypothetical protein [Polyangiaceae bacterium]
MASPIPRKTDERQTGERAPRPRGESKASVDIQVFLTDEVAVCDDVHLDLQATLQVLEVLDRPAKPIPALVQAIEAARALR